MSLADGNLISARWSGRRDYWTGAATARRGGYSVAVFKSLQEARETIGLSGPLVAGSPFQHPTWLTAWFKTAGRAAHVSPFVACIFDERRGELAMLLPLVTLREQGLTIIEFADLGITDYNAPLLGPASPRNAESARRLWAALTPSLPQADLIRLAKMPERIAGLPNPLTLLPASQPSPLSGNVVTVTSYAEFARERGRGYRKELERCRRVFKRLGGTGFRQMTDVEEALAVLRVIDEQQARRIRGLGLPYGLDAPELAEFYRTLVRDGLPTSYATVTALLAGDEVVAALLGVRDGETFTTLRISNVGEAWSACSPGRLVIDASLEKLSGEGCRLFDFTIGDYEFKRRLGAERLKLYEMTEAQSWRGMALATQAYLKGQLRQHPRLGGNLRRVLQRGLCGQGLMMARS